MINFLNANDQLLEVFFLRRWLFIEFYSKLWLSHRLKLFFDKFQLIQNLTAARTAHVKIDFFYRHFNSFLKLNLFVVIILFSFVLVFSRLHNLTLFNISPFINLLSFSWAGHVINEIFEMTATNFILLVSLLLIMILHSFYTSREQFNNVNSELPN